MLLSLPCQSSPLVIFPIYRSACAGWIHLRCRQQHFQHAISGPEDMTPAPPPAVHLSHRRFPITQHSRRLRPTLMEICTLPIHYLYKIQLACTITPTSTRQRQRLHAAPLTAVALRCSGIHVSKGTSVPYRLGAYSVPSSLTGASLAILLKASREVAGRTCVHGSRAVDGRRGLVCLSRDRTSQCWTSRGTSSTGYRCGIGRGCTSPQRRGLFG
ncbi:hypothetical protein R3P38DRAFT_891599 [Favolaschia claudopus]|uniref:Uncharacterized protein n=1 Tax=Favolaschia claudopus TaxID=2862362 RepID=A0AAW0BT89_9AGAR